MTQFSVLKEFFFSQICGLRIVDAYGEKVGKLMDMVVKWNGIAPTVTCIKYEKGPDKHLDILQIDDWGDHEIRLKQKGSLVGRAIAEEELYVRKWLLDKQIIDCKGSRLVRVNDIRLSLVQYANHYELVMVSMDVGIRGLLRRLGLEFLVKQRPHSLIGWQYFIPLQNRFGNLSLKEGYDQLNQLHPADIADILEELGHDDQKDLMRGFDNERLADVLTETELDTKVRIIEALENKQVAAILDEMPSDEAADILGELPAFRTNEILQLLKPQTADKVCGLMSYAENTAGAVMTTEYVAVPPYLTVADTIKLLRETAAEAETIYYIYVIAADRTLQGVFSLRDLIMAKPQAKVHQIMARRLFSILHREDYRKSFDLVEKYNLLAVPVINEQKQLVGIITLDDLLNIMLSERSGLRFW